MHVESLGNAHAVSHKGAMGLMQIMPQTWAGSRLRYGLGQHPYDAHYNIPAGAAYLRELHDRYSVPGFSAAYNAGQRATKTIWQPADRCQPRPAATSPSPRR